MSSNTSKKINYFDLGTHQGGTVGLFLDIAHEVKKENFNVFGFEPNSIYYTYCQRSFLKDRRVQLFQCAISDKEGEIPLYFSENSVGDSIFKRVAPICHVPDFPRFLDEHEDLRVHYLFLKGYTVTSRNPDGTVDAKSTHDPIEFENVSSIVFSNWLKDNIPDLNSSINILKVNIEGAEYHLFKDLEESDMLKYFDVFCGKGEDVYKIPELSNIFEEHTARLKNNRIEIHRFSDWKPERNVNLKKIIEDLS